MKLINCECRPGIVRTVCNNYGTIKASCCGVFSDDEDIDKLPPVYPAPFKTSNSVFSEPQIGDPIFVWFDKTNPQELYYTFQSDACAINDDILENGYDDIEIISKRNGGRAMFQYNNLDGWKLNNNDTDISIGEDNDIKLSQNSDSYVVEMTDDGIKIIGANGEQQPAVLGTKLTECLQSLIKGLQRAAKIGKSNPHTAPMAIALESSLIEVNSKLNNILSKNITIN